jgi:ABC-2 type transport system ATP-binding protein
VVTNAQSNILVEHLNKTYYPSPTWLRAMVKSNITQPVQALGDISFNVGPGEIVGMVGPNGAGKTTAFRVLVGLTTPTKGRASVMGFDSTTQSTQVRALVGWMPGDDRSLLMRLTCAENLRFHGRLQGLKPDRLDTKVREVLELVGLGHAYDKSIFALSAGMRARLQLARALLHDPRVLILDEPTAAVDPVASHALLNLIIEIVADRHLAAIVSSHRLEEIEALQSRVILLDLGTIRYDGDLDVMRQRLDRPLLEVEFADNDEAERAAKTLASTSLPITVAVPGEGKLECVLEHGTTPGSVLAQLDGLLPNVVRIDEVRRPLRELLAEIYGEDDTSADRDRRARPDGEERERKRKARPWKVAKQPKAERMRGGRR